MLWEISRKTPKLYNLFFLFKKKIYFCAKISIYLSMPKNI